MDTTLEVITPAALWRYVDTTLDFKHSSSTAGFRNMETREGTCTQPTVRVDILPEKGAHQLDTADIGVNPRIIAEIRVNTPDCIVDQWGFPGQKRSYWVVDKPAGATEVRSRFVAIDETTRTHLHGTSGPQQYRFRACPPRTTPAPTGSVAQWLEAKSHAEACAAAHLVGTANDTLPLMADDASAWISCFAGCCTANAT